MLIREKIEIEKHEHLRTPEDYEKSIDGGKKDFISSDLDPIDKECVLEESQFDRSLEVKVLDENGNLIKMDIDLDKLKQDEGMLNKLESDIEEFKFEKVILADKNQSNKETEFIESLHLPVSQFIKYHIGVKKQIKNLKEALASLENLEKELREIIGEDNLDLSEHFKNSMLANISDRTDKIVEYINNGINNTFENDPIKIEED